LKRRILI